MLDTVKLNVVVSYGPFDIWALRTNANHEDTFPQEQLC